MKIGHSKTIPTDEALEAAEKDEGSNDVMERQGSFKELFSTADKIDYFLMFVGSIGGLVTGLSMPYTNILFGRMVDSLNEDPDSFSDAVESVALSFVYVSCVNLVSATLMAGCWGMAGERQAQRLREKYVRSILRQEIGWFDTCGADALATKVAEITGKLQDGMGRKVGDLINFSSMLIGSYAAGFYFSWKLSLVLLASFPFIGGTTMWMVSSITSATTQTQEDYASAGATANEALNNMRTVTALNIQPHFITRYRSFLYDSMVVGIKKGTAVGMSTGTLFAIMLSTYAFGFWYGGVLVAQSMDDGCLPTEDSAGCISGGTVVATFFCIIVGSFSLGQIGPPLSAVFGAKAALGPMMDVIEREPKIDGFSAEGTKLSGKAMGAVELGDVHFCYPSRPEIPVCQGYNLTIEPGEVVALVGPSGSGKSTIVNLLQRFYDVDSGSITLDGKDIREYNISWLRQQMGYVGQEPVLFKGTIAENIGFGLGRGSKDDITADDMKAIEAAAKLSNAHDFITAFPDGYRTDIGSKGLSVSGGQKQRIAIARALVRKPAILLLDEATSALDATSEKLVQASIDELQKSKAQTTIVIAHRLSTIRNADKIAVIDKGKIVECGTHDELLAKKGRYTNLVSAQVTDEGRNVGGGGSKDNLNALVDADTAAAGAVGTAGDPSTPRDTSLKAGAGATVGGALPDKDEGEVTETAEEKKAREEAEAAEEKIAKGRASALVWEHWAWMSIGIVGAMGFGMVFPAWGFLLAETFDVLFQPTSDEVLDKSSTMSFYYIIIALAALLSVSMSFFGSTQLGERVSIALRSNMFEAIMRREMTFFDMDENAIGALTVRLSDDTRLVSKATGDTLPKTLQCIFTLVVGVGVGLYASWKVTLVVFATIPLNAAAAAVQDQNNMGQSGNEDPTSGQEGAIISTAFNSMRTVSAFNMHHRVCSDYLVETGSISRTRAKNAGFSGFAFGMSNAVTFCTYAGVFYYGSVLIQDGEITFKELMRSLFCVMFGIMGLGNALNDMADQKEGAKAAVRIFKAIDAAESCTIDGLSTKGAFPDSPCTGKIVFNGVDFCYPSRPEIPVCQGYNLTIEPGEVVALVGPSGSGKSTIVNLLQRFYDVDSGSITLDGKDIREYNVRWLRQQMGYVGQEPVLFKGSVEENIRLGKSGLDSVLPTINESVAAKDKAAGGPLHCGCDCLKTSSPDAVHGFETSFDEAAVAIDISQDELVAATTASNAHDFITAFPDGYSSDVGESSLMVSGGQKQRIAIARALVRKPAILLLDEATSALDATSEKLVQASIDELQKSKAQTTIVIAHRLSTIRNADKIAVIDKGKIVECGTHDELLNNASGLYQMLWHKQSEITGGDAK